MRNIGSLPRQLPREEILTEPAIDTCPCCRGVLHRIREDVSEMLDRAGGHPGQTHPLPSRWLPHMRGRRGASTGSAASDRAHSRNS